MEILFTKKELTDELHRVTAHLGVKLGAPEFVASCDDDAPKIELLMRSSVDDLVEVMLPYAHRSEEDLFFKITLSMPCNWKSDRIDTLRAECGQYLHYALLSRWLDFVKPDSAMLYRTLNKTNEAAVQHILSLREKPLR